MKTIDFLFLKHSKIRSVLMGGLLALAAAHASAGPAPVDSFDQHAQLILTPSDNALLPAEQGGQPFLSQSAISNANLQQTEKRKNRPVKLGCGVDVNQFSGEDSSLSNRLVGECNLDYRY